MDIIDQLNGIVPAKYVTWATAAFLASQVLGRAYQAIVKGGGLRSIVRGIWLGTNTPKDEQ